MGIRLEREEDETGQLFTDIWVYDLNCGMKFEEIIGFALFWGVEMETGIYWV